jgi:hypothetical protein
MEGWYKIVLKGVTLGARKRFERVLEAEGMPK